MSVVYVSTTWMSATLLACNQQPQKKKAVVWLNDDGWWQTILHEGPGRNKKSLARSRVIGSRSRKIPWCDACPSIHVVWRLSDDRGKRNCEKMTSISIVGARNPTTAMFCAAKTKDDARFRRNSMKPGIRCERIDLVFDKPIFFFLF